MKKAELEVRKELTERAEQQFGPARAAELRADIEQLSAEIVAVADFEVGIQDEP